MHVRLGSIRPYAAEFGAAAFPRRDRGPHRAQAVSRRSLSDPRREAVMSDVQLTIDGIAVTVPEGTTVFDAARLQGIQIPTLCRQQNETPVGVCRVCVVDVGQRVFAASCVRAVDHNDDKKLVVTTNSDKVRQARRTLIELLMADHPSPCARQRHSNDCELETLAKLEGITHPRLPPTLSPRGQDNSSLVISVRHEACIS